MHGCLPNNIFFSWWVYEDSLHILWKDIHFISKGEVKPTAIIHYITRLRDVRQKKAYLFIENKQCVFFTTLLHLTYVAYPFFSWFSSLFFILLSPRGDPPPPAWVDSDLTLSLKNMPYFVQFPTRSETHEYVLIDVFGWINYIFSFDNHYNHLLSGHSGKSCFYNCSSWLSLTLHIDRASFFDFDKTYLCIL